MQSHPLRRLALAVTLAAPAMGFAMASPVAAGSPSSAFSCSSGAFEVLNQQLVQLDASTGATTPVGSPSSLTYNAMGFNPIDSYVYAISVKSGVPHVVKIGTNGGAVDLGITTGDSWGAKPSFLAGDVNDRNQLVVLTTSNTLWKINLNSLVARSVTLSSPALGADAVYASGSFYTVQGNKLYAINETTGAVSTKSVARLTKLNPGGKFGAGFADGSGNLVFAAYTSGALIKVSNFLTASPTASAAFSGTAAANIDAATCRPPDPSSTDTVTYDA